MITLLQQKIGCPLEFHHSFTYMAPSSDCSLMTLKLKLPFRVILRKFEVVVLCLLE